MAENEALRNAPATSQPSDATLSWESERLELVKVRDEALTRANVGDFV